MDAEVNQSNQWCGICRERLWEIENSYSELFRQHNNNDCPFCHSDTLSIGDDFSRSNNTVDTDDSTEYLLIDIEELTSMASSYNTAEEDELSDDAAFDEFLLRTPPYMTDEAQVEEAEIHHYPIRSTRSDIDSYYETPLRSRFWTKRRSSSRSRRDS